MVGNFCHWNSMRNLETRAGYAVRSPLELGREDTTRPCTLLKLWVPSISSPGRLERLRRDSLRHTRMPCCFVSQALVCPATASGLPSPDHSLSWQQRLVLGVLMISYLPLACISPSLSLLCVWVGNYTCTSPLPHRQRRATHSPESGSS